MDNLDKEFNQRFQYEKLPNDSFDIEQLWDSVEDRLNEKSKRRPIVPLFFFGCLFSSLLLIGIAFLIWNSTKHQNASPSPTIEPSKVVADKQQVFEHGRNAIPKKRAQGEVIENITIDTASKKTNVALIQSKKQLVQETSNPKFNVSTLAQKKSPFSKEAYHAHPSLNKKQKKQTVEENDLSINETITSFSKLPTKACKPLYNANSNNAFPKSISLHPSTKTLLKQTKNSKKEKKMEFAIHLSGGVNRSNFSYHHSDSSAIGDLKTAAEGGDFGQSLGLELTLITPKGFLFNGGVAYNKGWTIFDFTNNRSEQVLRENQLLKVWINGTDTLRQEMGDAMVTVNTQRMVRHHNPFTQFSIPLSVGYQIEKGKFTYGIRLGTVFNFLLNQSGKAFDELGELIIPYNTTSNHAPLNQFNIGLRANAFLAYDLTDTLMLSLSPNWSFQRHNKASQRVDLQQVGLNVGFQLKL